MNNFYMFKKYLVMVLIFLLSAFVFNPAFASNSDPPKTGKITGKTVVGGLLSLVIWPGIGQAMNSNQGKKVTTHVVIGLLPPFRIWSGYDALVDRSGGYWNGKI